MKTRAKIKRIVTMALLALFLPSVALAAPRLPNDTYLVEQWYLPYIKATEAWNTTLGFEGVIVAVIDSGIDIDHDDLRSNIWRNQAEVAGNGLDDDRNGYVDDVSGWDFVDGDNDPRPDLSDKTFLLGVNHGTINAGVIAAAGDNGQGISGVTWQSKIMALRALDSSGSGDPYAVVRAVEYAVHNGAKIINLSFSGPIYNETLRIALRNAYDRGVLVVAAAGNSSNNRGAIDLAVSPQYPVCFDAKDETQYILGVAATDERDRRGNFSNYGTGCIDISAPGTRMISTQVYRPGQPDFDVQYSGYYNGSSLSAPIVSGVAALVLSLDLRQTPADLMKLLMDSSVSIDALNPGFEKKLGKGRVDAYAAVLAYTLLKSRPRVETAPRTATLVPPNTKRVVLTAPGAGRVSDIRMYTLDGSFIRSFKAFPDAFRGGASIATADFNGSGRKSSIIVAAGSGGSPQLRIFNENTEVVGGFLAFGEGFKGGVNLAAGDLDGDGKDEIVVGAGLGGGPQVRMFAADGTTKGSFFAFDSRWKTGTQVAVGDLNGDGEDDIVTAPMLGTRNPFSVVVYDRRGQRLASFVPNGTVDRRGGTITVIDVDGDGKDEIMVEAAGARETYAYGFDGKRYATIDAKRNIKLVAGTASSGFGTGALPQPIIFGTTLRATSSVSVLLRPNGQPLTFTAFEPKFLGGVRTARLDL